MLMTIGRWVYTVFAVLAIIFSPWAVKNAVKGKAPMDLVEAVGWQTFSIFLTLCVLWMIWH